MRGDDDLFSCPLSPPTPPALRSRQATGRLWLCHRCSWKIRSLLPMRRQTSHDGQMGDLNVAVRNLQSLSTTRQQFVESNVTALSPLVVHSPVMGMARSEDVEEDADEGHALNVPSQSAPAGDERTDPFTAYEYTVAALLDRALRHWPGSLLRQYPAHVERLVSLLRREFPSLVPPEALFILESPTQLLESTRHARVGVAAVDVARGKKKQKLTLTMTLNGEKRTVACTTKGTSERDEIFFLAEDTNKNVLQVSVWKSEYKFLGSGSVDISDGGDEFDCELAMDNRKVGNVKLCIETVNKHSQFAAAKVRRVLNETLSGGLRSLFMGYPKIDSVLRQLHDVDDTKDDVLAIEIEQQSHFSMDGETPVVLVNDEEAVCAAVMDEDKVLFLLSAKNLTETKVSLQLRR